MIKMNNSLQRTKENRYKKNKLMILTISNRYAIKKISAIQFNSTIKINNC